MFFTKKQRETDKTIMKGAKYFSEDDQSVTIHIKAENHNQIFSEYNYEDKTTLNSALCEYLWDNAKLTPIDKNLNIKIYDKANINGDDVGCAIRSHYRREYVEEKDKLKKIDIFSISCLLIGIIILVALAFIHQYLGNYLVEIILEILAWVFVWESADRWFLERPKIKRKCLRIQQLYSAKISIIK